VQSDNNESLRWIKRAAQQHFPPAEFLLGTMYETGFASSKDLVEAGRWYRKAAEAGYAAAQTNLGILYERGDGVPKDLPEAARWYKRAAEQGDASGCANLARLYANGIGVATDYKLAYFWTIAAQYRESAMANALPQSFVQELNRRLPENERSLAATEAQDWIRAHPLPAPEQGFVNALAAVSGLRASGVAP
jgi:TPR repeat protein